MRKKEHIISFLRRPFPEALFPVYWTKIRRASPQGHWHVQSQKGQRSATGWIGCTVCVTSVLRSSCTTQVWDIASSGGSHPVSVCECECECVSCIMCVLCVVLCV